MKHRLVSTRLRAGFLGLALVMSPGIAAGGWAGWLRLSGNIHEFDAGMYRSGQLGPDRLSAFVMENGIKTVLNLRGENPGKSWYDQEISAVQRTGADYVSIPLSANHEPDSVILARLIHTLGTARKPMMLHCEAGADRSGLAAALYEFVVQHRSAHDADRQLSFRYGHFPWLTSRSGAMDRTFATVVSSRDTVGE